MFYRRAGIRHTRYQDERQLFPLGFDRGLIIVVIAILLAAPFIFDRLYVSGYLLPWLIWTSAALGLNLLMGWSGQIHLGYGAVMGIGAYGSVHLVRLGVPLEIAMIAGGLHGIRNKMELGAPFVGNGYEAPDIPRIPWKACIIKGNFILNGGENLSAYS